MKVEVICNFCKKTEKVFKSRAKNYKFCSRECMSKAFFKGVSVSINQRINNWRIIDDKPFRKYGRGYYKVECTCGSGIKKDLYIEQINKKSDLGCRECSRNHNFKGIYELSGDYLSMIRRGARIRDFEFNVTKEYLWNLFIQQESKCTLSGLDIFLGENKTASLDRIDSLKGYIEGNLQWVHKDVNLMKNKFNQEYFIKMCKNISKINEGRNKKA